MGNKYKKNFLTNVIVRVDFPNPLKTDTLPPDFTKVILKSFPISEPKKLVQMVGTFKVEPKKKLEVETGEEMTEWNYYGVNREKRLVIQKDILSISYLKSYKGFEDLKSEFLNIIEKLFEVFKDIQINRLGLRYINEINLDETDSFNWKKYLNSNLLSIFNITENKDIIARGLNNLILNYGNMILNFHYGMHNPDFPAAIRKKIFVLDYDAYYTGLYELKDIESNLLTFHEEIEKLFENNIEDGLREVMYGN
ncbi:MAG: hypothetical protein MPEBLZ_02889 [Candidatus Methanoperedens nitroreducens]|uniref:TIGR04255 family protein n=1 Tax=Candidatus Methanoperedens nitratireducens TaxID=1392998 RepID=A0A0P8A7E7_9EURY|nr:TIGR04255 family protein [Candidatus Methanoperedens sp. BLZ2]KAB2945776.1 MAG: TIGR04255 family protein [Candidatus Methanoperedens sp.]KPQ42543.1 MAG: hypothetical protein MPEBLZ_02889 [Candidatus Methanoperedens sp. BLZ1]MBZ0174266.1 TIGR04255 family protein [Candidatus Methanoperedens nitroreducens]CAG0986986.1 hypothetical protein METP2_02334 [Methanosarcinales archaeon]MCX9077317.1 TIGR04255 family protein [Candidatus Methanoperedens sp.]